MVHSVCLSWLTDCLGKRTRWCCNHMNVMTWAPRQANWSESQVTGCSGSRAQRGPRSCRLDAYVCFFTCFVVFVEKDDLHPQPVPQSSFGSGALWCVALTWAGRLLNESKYRGWHVHHLPAAAPVNRQPEPYAHRQRGREPTTPCPSTAASVIHGCELIGALYRHRGNTNGKRSLAHGRSFGDFYGFKKPFLL